MRPASCGLLEADGEIVDLSAPYVEFGFADPVTEVVRDLDQPGALAGVDAQDRASDAGVLVLAGGAVGAAAGAEFQLACVEVLLEFGPFLVGWFAVLVGWPDRATLARNAR
ncbi:hypothetical protein ED92_26875 [Amycolatopsis sp. MJM2582]|uniref:hypothetical protein n=1 Tax=Amycolatopsis sp. MJM2582 TaxID=1427749 RepID=UPI000502B12F|nr:hypothetical protein [Amycolatopsis sp. MJM2582]KFZ79213.1 hypothetical protein ED92_26875 [Amycolatopsis sp. MJM2582]